MMARRTRPRHALKCLFLGAIVIATPRATLAQSPPPHREHVRFSYSAPEDCPTREEFMANVHDRAAELIDDPEAARSLAVSIEHDDGWQGELRTEGIANGEGTRQIRGDSCASVAKSLFPELACMVPRSVPNGKRAIALATAPLSTNVQCGRVAACVFLRRLPAQVGAGPYPVQRFRVLGGRQLN